MAPRGHGAATPAPGKTEPTVELEVDGPATEFADTLAVCAAMSEGGLLRGLHVGGRLVFTRDGLG